MPGPAGILAISGGADSFSLLDAVAAVAPDRIGVVATFDHGTGAAARQAAARVMRWARRRRLPVAVGRLADPGAAAGREAEWRAQRWQFLHAVRAQAGGLPVWTAHSWDDQVETVCMRILRGAGARGLAGLATAGPVWRPLLSVRRSTLAAYADARRLPTTDDPANRDRRHLRVRVRLDLLPALEQAHPGVREWLWSLGARAAAWRSGVEAFVAAHHPLVASGTDEYLLALAPLRPYGPSELAVLLPALLAPAGIVLDRRGTVRLCRFIIAGVAGQEIQLAGGVVVRRRRAVLVVGRSLAVDDVGP
jgi:tRNA(Ile)-lysidine synthase